MPYAGTVGCSRFTRSKQESFAYIIDSLVPMVSAIQVRAPWASEHSLWVDLYAGPGAYQNPETGDELLGSPVILMRALMAQSRRVSSFEPRLVLVERDPETAELLRQTVAHEQCSFAEVVCADCRTWLEEFNLGTQAPFGLVYADPNGERPPSTELGTFFSSRDANLLDCLLYVSATNIKRVRCCRETGDERCLADHMAAICKRRALVRRPEGRHQWAHLLMTNSPASWDFRSRGFFDVETATGRAILDALDRTAHELDCDHSEHGDGCVQLALGF